jgi:hypothetical protein
MQNHISAALLIAAIAALGVAKMGVHQHHPDQCSPSSSRSVEELFAPCLTQVVRAPENLTISTIGRR